MPASSPSERHLIARAAAHQSWATTANRTARTARGRDAFLAKFEDQVDPNRQLPAEERARRAANARQAYFANLARKSARARRRSGARRVPLDELVEATLLLAATKMDEDDPPERSDGDTECASPTDVGGAGE